MAIESLWRDIRWGIRALSKDRTFSLVAVITLALGIGATTAIVSVVRSVLWHDLPFADSSSLVFLHESVGPTGVGSVSYPNYLDWRIQNSVFSDMAAYASNNLNLVAGRSAQRVAGELVTDSYLPLLRIAPTLGRNFSAEENQNPNAPSVAIISHGLWTREFAKDSEVLGRVITVNEAAFTVIGVAPERFNGVTGHADLWIPLGMQDRVNPDSAKFHFNAQRDIHWHRALGRLKPGIGLDQAREQMKIIGDRLALAYPQANKERSVQCVSASEVYLGKLRSPLLLLLGAAACIFLISCFNVANLFMIRAASRDDESAVRSALGAARSRLMQQWIVEGILIAVAGGALGSVVAIASISGIVNVLPVRLPSFSSVKVDGGVLAFTAAISILTGAGLGMVAALRGSRRDVVSSLKKTAKSSPRGFARITSGLLVIAELAVAVVVTIGAGLLLRSFQELRHADPGFAADHLVMARFDVPSAKYTAGGRLQVAPQVQKRIAALPQVQSAALTNLDPFVWGGINRGITVDGHTPLSAAEQDEIYVQEITPDYFETMKIKLRSGRDFTDRDDSAALPVAIVSHTFARKYWPNQDVVGKRMKYGPVDSRYPWMQIVGEADDVRFSSLRTDPNAAAVIYAPMSQSEWIVNMSVLARTRTDPVSAIADIRQEIQRLDPEIPVYSVATMDARIEGETEATRSFATLLALFAFLGIGLAAVGTYAAMAARVARRRHEIGIRMALGAAPRAVLGLVLLQGAELAFAGVTVGVFLGLWTGRLLTSELFGIHSADPLTFVAGSLLVAGITVAACWVPSRRAMRVDPVSALRAE